MLVAAGCATTSSGGSSSRSSSTEITREEIAETSAQNAYEVIERIRPQWLNTRGGASMANPEGSEPVVYLDGARAGGLRELVSIRANVVVRIEYLRSSDATNRYGTGHQGGAILVTTR
jgi:outer membrane cobalamin receptor